MTQRPTEILLVEDNPADALLAKEALLDNNIPCNLHIVNNGEDALHFLYQEGEYEEVPLPDLILLDLNLPRKGGLAVLAEIKANQRLRRIPVIVLTTSDNPDDILRAYDLQASSYITKPSDLDGLDQMMKSVSSFCLTVVQLPPREE